MVGLLKRMRKVQTRLLAIRLGSGAYTLSKDVARIHMRFAPKIDGGHRAPRHFWRHELVRLKYHNPAVQMTIDRMAAQSDPATMTIFFTPKDAPKTSKSSTAAPVPTTSTSGDSSHSDYTPTERTETISMTNTSPENILEQLVKISNAVPVQPSPEDARELEALQEARRKSERDSAISLEHNRARNAEKALLAQARGELN